MIHPTLLLLSLSIQVGSAAQLPGDTARLEPMVVTATRVPVPSAVASQAVTVLNGDDLRQRGVVRVGDALREVPGLAVVQSGPTGALTAVFARGGESDYMKVLIDGVPVNEAGGAFDFAHLTTDNIERIEIVRGPTSVLYGSDAVSGVVNLISRRPRSTTAIEATGRGGENGTLEGDVSVNGSRLIGHTFSASHRVTDGIYDFNNRYTSTALSGLVQGTRGATTARLSARHLSTKYQYPTDFAGRPVDSNSVRTERRTVIALAAGHRMTPRVAASWQLSANEVRAISDDQPDFAADGSYSRDDARTHRRSADARVDIELRPTATITAGYEFQHQGEDRSGTSSFGDPLPFDETRSNHAYYTEFVAGTPDGASVILGGRLDDNERFGMFTTGRIAGSLPLGVEARVRGAIGSAFKEPAFAEVFTTTFSVGNAVLGPERSVSMEIGIDVDRRHAALALTAFRQEFRDMIQYVAGVGPDDFRGHSENLASARASGVELDLRSRWEGPVTGAATYTFVQTEVREAGTSTSGAFASGRELLRRPRHAGTVRLDWRGSGRAGASLLIHHVGNRDDYDFTADQRVVLPAYERLDVEASLALSRGAAGRPSSTLMLRVDNLLDRRYEHVLGFPAPGRVLLLGVRVGTILD